MGCQNFRSSIVNRPPLVVFGICLIFFLSVTLFLGFYIRGKENALKNPDQLSWNDLFIGLTHLNYCFSHKNIKATKTTSFHKTTFFKASFQLKISEEVKSKESNLILANGNIPLYDFQTRRLFQTKFSKITLLVDKTTNNVCISLFNSSSSSLQSLINLKPGPLPCDILISNRTMYDLNFESRLSKLDASWCQNKTLYSPTAFVPAAEWNIMVSKDDLEVIYYHLMSTSFFLCCIIAALIAVSCYKGSNSRNMNVKQPVFRGNMELLRRSPSPYSD